MALTIRLTDEETEKLKEISEHLSKGSAAGTITKMIHHYMPLQRNYESTELDLKELRHEYNHFIATLQTMFDSQDALGKLVKLKT